MARLTESFTTAWRALSAQDPTQGWRSIAVDPAGPCPLLAARKFPNNEEALLAGFGQQSAVSLLRQKLPDALGFEVTTTDRAGDGRMWLAVSRKQAGNSSLFAEMVCDVADVMDLEALRSGGEVEILTCMLARIRAWQEFMRKGTQILTLGAELGLVGELFVFTSLLDAGVRADIVSDGWVGPLESPQDFHLGHGAIEVKTTLAPNGFHAKVGSLAQLDESTRSPLFMAAVRVALSPQGKTLAQIIGDTQTRLSGDPEALRLFTDRVLMAGYRKGDADQYLRTFYNPLISIIPVQGQFPRLTAGTVPTGVCDASYEIDAQPWVSSALGIAHALKALGVS